MLAPALTLIVKKWFCAPDQREAFQFEEKERYILGNIDYLGIFSIKAHKNIVQKS